MNQKLYILFLFFIFVSNVYSQKHKQTTDSFIISGKIKKELTYVQNHLDTFTTNTIENFDIYNQRGELKSKAVRLKGFSIMKILSLLEFPVDKPKELNSFIFIFESTDSNRIVFSWNEIFNTDIGNSIYIITEKDGKKMKFSDEKILIVSLKDHKIGRRYMERVNRIIVERID